MTLICPALFGCIGLSDLGAAVRRVGHHDFCAESSGAIAIWTVEPLFADPFTALATIMLALGAFVFWVLVRFGFIVG